MTKSNALVRSKLRKAQSLATSGRPLEAVQLLEQICRKDKRSAEAWFMQGTILASIGQMQKAIDCLRQSIKINPGNALTHYNLGELMARLGDFQQAVSCYSKALKLDSRKPEILRALAKAQFHCGRPEKAIEAYKRFLSMEVADAGALGGLAACYFLTGELENARSFYQQALALKNDPAWLDGLGATLCRQGMPEAAIAAHRAAIKLSPDNMSYRSNLLLSLHYANDASVQEILEEHKAWPQTVDVKLRGAQKYSNLRSRDRRIKIGYVSPDFRTHSVSYFFEPLIRQHDAEAFETFCYSLSSHQDETTMRLRECATHWRDVSQMNAQQTASQINSDGVDILVDLAGHTAGNRLALFTFKPAPIQVAWLGYPATTGLSAIDYRFTDAYADPAGYESGYSERLLRLPGSFLCYMPPENGPPVSTGPVNNNGYITFGSFNNLAKINSNVLAVWSSLLKEVPESRLILKNPSLSDKRTAELFMDVCVKQGLPEESVTLLGFSDTTMEHLDSYRLLDIALDTFPYNGTTTTCESLYMGVPVITLKGDKHAGRVGTSLLLNLGQDELVAESTEEYVCRAADLARDPRRLASARGSLRSHMQSSLLCDSALFARSIEQVYRRIWGEWCDARAGNEKNAI